MRSSNGRLAEWFTADGWIDISRPLSAGTRVWPGDRGFERHEADVGGLVVSWLATTCHVGTHLDAPRHLDAAAAAVDAVPLDRLIGPAEVVEAALTGTTVGRESLPPGWRPRAPRVLLRTGCHPLDAPIDERVVGIDPRLIHTLADLGVELVGTDSPSVDPFASDTLPGHRALLERGLTWIEGLWLGSAPAGTYLLVALPLPLAGAEAAPLRAVLGRIDAP
jgi:arylformamidase